MMCEQGNLKEAVDYFELVHKGGLQMSPKSYCFLLQYCAKMKALDEGKKVHAILITSDVRVGVTLRNHLLSLYVKCECLNEAKLMFDSMGCARDVVSWTLMINVYAQSGKLNEAMKIYYTMRKRKVRPNKITYVCLLKACGRLPDGLATGKILHEHIIRRMLDGDQYVGGALVDMYFKFAQVKSARKAFYAISRKKDVLWNHFIVGLVMHGRNQEALRVYQHMRSILHMEPSDAAWVHILKACGDLEELEEGRLSHFCLCRDGIELDGCVGQELVHMYISCGCLLDARHIFDQMKSRSVSLWKCLMDAYTKSKQYDEATKLTLQMQEYKELPFELAEIDNIQDFDCFNELSFNMEESEKLFPLSI
ncbi:hypothetical protein KP509_10G068600 [Ceratopteris richardii]|nr:hypothetical protein KP509_10G068600 [Ceratopteris richardii]KAH7427951.1 hypothetical protein KP509_10G068600 [Ceratopteris richardii]KAH7427952.1 hypothetical protein KP509_10G068600 [Ceratopteris richardii]